MSTVSHFFLLDSLHCSFAIILTACFWDWTFWKRFRYAKLQEHMQYTIYLCLAKYESLGYLSGKLLCIMRNAFHLNCKLKSQERWRVSTCGQVPLGTWSRALCPLRNSCTPRLINYFGQSARGNCTYKKSNRTNSSDAFRVFQMQKNIIRLGYPGHRTTFFHKKHRGTLIYLLTAHANIQCVNICRRRVKTNAFKHLPPSVDLR